jgi:hypothetical protein
VHRLKRSDARKRSKQGTTPATIGNEARKTLTVVTPPRDAVQEVSYVPSPTPRGAELCAFRLTPPTCRPSACRPSASRPAPSPSAPATGRPGSGEGAEGSWRQSLDIPAPDLAISTGRIPAAGASRARFLSHSWKARMEYAVGGRFEGGDRAWSGKRWSTRLSAC